MRESADSRAHSFVSQNRCKIFFSISERRSGLQGGDRGTNPQSCRYCLCSASTTPHRRRPTVHVYTYVLCTIACSFSMEHAAALMTAASMLSLNWEQQLWPPLILRALFGCRPLPPPPLRPLPHARAPQSGCEKCCVCAACRVLGGEGAEKVTMGDDGGTLS